MGSISIAIMYGDVQAVFLTSKEKIIKVKIKIVIG